MKKRIISLVLAVCLVVCLLPAAMAEETGENAAQGESYKVHTAIGDSICAGFAQSDYEYVNGFDMMSNIVNSPESCYAQKVGKMLNAEVYNLGKCGCDTTELLDILTNLDNEYYGTYQTYIEKGELITLEIGSNDLLMAEVEVILHCVGGKMGDLTHQEAMALAEPVLTGDPQGLVTLIETVTGNEPSEEQIEAIKNALSDENLSATLEAAYNVFCANFPSVVDAVEAVNQDAELVILNYYNPLRIYDEALGYYTFISSTWGDKSYNTGEIIQTFIDEMNGFTLDYCRNEGYIYVDISDTPTNIIDPHPSEYGHTQIAGRIVDALTNVVTATAQKGGTITPSGVNIVENGGSLTFSIAADGGYTIGDVLADGVSVGPVSTYTFYNVTGDHQITAAFIIDEGTAPEDGTVYYGTYTAFGDSITAGYRRPEYTGDYCNPPDGYVAIAAKDFGTVNNYNLGLLGFKSGDLLTALTDSSNDHYGLFTSDIADSDLVTINIGSNDLTMALLDMIFECLGCDIDNLSPEERFEAIRPFVDETTLDAFFEKLEEIYGEDAAEEMISEIGSVLNESSVDEKFGEAYTQFTSNWDGIINAVNAIRRDNNKPDVAIVAIGLYDVGPDLGDYGDITSAVDTVSEKYVAMMNDYISAGSPTADQYLYVDTTGVELITYGGITVDPHPSKAGHAYIAAKLADRVLNVIVSCAGEGGGISPEGTETVAYGRSSDYSYAYAFTPDSGNSIVDVEIDGEKTEAPDGTYIFEKVSSDHTISVSFEEETDAPDVYIPQYVPDSTNYFTVHTSSTAGGSVSLSNSGRILKGSNVTITITPETGYEIDYIVLDGEMLSAVSTVTIRSISSDHSIFAAFKASGGGEDEQTNYTNPFDDVKDSDWFYEAVMYTHANGIVKGTSASTFDPEAEFNLAMIRTLLYQMDNEPSETYDDGYPFKSGLWYTNSFIWALKNKLTILSENSASDPLDTVTREEIAQTLYLYAKMKGYDVSAAADLSAYTDSEEISEWAEDAMRWAVAEGIISGVGGGLLEPGGTATRAEVVTILYRFIQKYCV